jgi:hypothetical protein
LRFQLEHANGQNVDQLGLLNRRQERLQLQATLQFECWSRIELVAVHRLRDCAACICELEGNGSKLCESWIIRDSQERGRRWRRIGLDRTELSRRQPGREDGQAKQHPRRMSLGPWDELHVSPPFGGGIPPPLGHGQFLQLNRIPNHRCDVATRGCAGGTEPHELQRGLLQRATIPVDGREDVLVGGFDPTAVHVQ